MESYDVSIAMATYQGEAYIHQQLISIRDQTLRPFEIIICDDQSSDRTLDIVQGFSENLNILVFVNERPLGVVKNFEKAISLCNSNYIALCDQDDVWIATKLEDDLKKMKIIEIDKEIPSLVFSDLEVVDEDLKLISHSLWKHLGANPARDNFYELLFGNVVTGCTIMLNHAFVKYLKNIPQEAIMHDYWASLIAYGFGQVGIIEKPLVKYRQHRSNVTNNYKRSISNRAGTLFKTIRSQRNTFLEAELVQAKRYYQLYEDKLNKETLTALERFIELENDRFWKRKWQSVKSNHYWLRRILNFVTNDN